MKPSDATEANPTLPGEVTPGQALVLRNENTHSLTGIFCVLFKNGEDENSVSVCRFEPHTMFFSVPKVMAKGAYEVIGKYASTTSPLPEERVLGTVQVRTSDT